MDFDLARYSARAAFRMSRDLQEVMAMFSQHLPEDEYRAFAADIAGAIHAINTALLDRAIASQPELKAEIDTSIDRYGSYL